MFTLAKDMDPAGLTMFSMFNQTMVARMDQMKMMELLREFRISTADVTTISNVQITAQPAMWAKLREALGQATALGEDRRGELLKVGKGRGHT